MADCETSERLSRVELREELSSLLEFPFDLLGACWRGFFRHVALCCTMLQCFKGLIVRSCSSFHRRLMRSTQGLERVMVENRPTFSHLSAKRCSARCFHFPRFHWQRIKLQHRVRGSERTINRYGSFYTSITSSAAPSASSIVLRAPEEAES